MDEWTGEVDKSLQNKLCKLFYQAVDKTKSELLRQ
jgi:hypothetical protein